MGKEQNSEKLTREALVSEIRSKAEKLFTRTLSGGMRIANFELSSSTFKNWIDKYGIGSQLDYLSGVSKDTRVILFDSKRIRQNYLPFTTGKTVRDLNIHLVFSNPEDKTSSASENCILDLEEKSNAFFERTSGKSEKASVKTLEAFNGLLDVIPQEPQK